MKVFPVAASWLSAALLGTSNMVSANPFDGLAKQGKSSRPHELAKRGRLGRLPRKFAPKRMLNHVDEDERWWEGINEGDWDIKKDIYPDENGDGEFDSDKGFGWQVDITDDSETVIVGSYNSGHDGCCVAMGPDPSNPDCCVNGTEPSSDPDFVGYDACVSDTSKFCFENCVNDVTAAGEGSARVFVRSTNGDGSVDWAQQGHLIGVDPEDPGAKYAGYTVDIDGNTAIVAAFKLPCNNGNVRVFTFVP